MAGRRAALLMPLLLAACGEKAVRVEPASAIGDGLPFVLPWDETEPVQTADDAADDPAIWVHPTDASRSLIVGSQKKYGVLIYGLDGRLRQSLPVGRINNVDLRDGFVLGGKTVAIVAGTNRSDDTLALFALDPDSGELREVAAGKLATGFRDPYGLCLYRSAGSGEFHAIANDKDGRVRQWRLKPGDDGRVSIELLREFRLKSQPEGCVADDEQALLFLGEEDYGLWVMPAEPEDGEAMRPVDRAGAGGHLVADVEGMALWTAPGGEGYLVVSSQGEHAYAIYRRRAPHAFVGKFRILGDARKGIDGVSETDGLDISSADLGGAYARGLMVVQDGYNLEPPQNQNFKLVPWSEIERKVLAPSP